MQTLFHCKDGWTYFTWVLIHLCRKNEQYNCLKMYALFSKVVILNVDLMATQIWSKYSSLKGVLFFNTRINHWIHRHLNSLLGWCSEKQPALSIFVFQLIHSLPEIHSENKKNVCFECCFMELTRGTALMNRHSF